MAPSMSAGPPGGDEFAAARGSHEYRQENFQEDDMLDAAHRRWVIVLTSIGSVMAAIDTLVVSTAIPTIRTDLEATLPQLEWTVNAYNLSLAVLLVPAAVLGDRFGRARCYAAGLVLFALSSIGAAVSGSAGVLIAMRTAQGAGAALLLTLGLA